MIIFHPSSVGLLLRHEIKLAHGRLKIENICSWKKFGRCHVDSLKTGAPALDNKERRGEIPLSEHAHVNVRKQNKRNLVEVRYLPMMSLWTFFLLLCHLSLSMSFYLPGLAPVTYCQNAEEGKCRTDINLLVNRLNSEESVIPYEYDQ